MEQLRNNGYDSVHCALAVACAACRSLVRKQRVTIVSPFDDNTQILVTCTREEEGLCQYVKRNAEGVLIRATTVWNEEVGVDLAVGEGILIENGVPAIPQSLLSALLSVLLRESRGKAVRLVISSDAEALAFDEMTTAPFLQKEKKTVAVLLGETNDETLKALKTRYGDEGVKQAGESLGVLFELAKSAALNVLFAGTIGDIARFMGICPCETTHVLSCFKNATDGFVIASSPLLLDEVRNHQTLELLQKLSAKNIKTGILITQS